MYQYEMNFQLFGRCLCIFHQGLTQLIALEDFVAFIHCEDFIFLSSDCQSCHHCHCLVLVFPSSFYMRLNSSCFGPVGYLIMCSVRGSYC